MAMMTSTCTYNWKLILLNKFGEYMYTAKNYVDIQWTGILRKKYSKDHNFDENRRAWM